MYDLETPAGTHTVNRYIGDPNLSPLVYGFLERAVLGSILELEVLSGNSSFILTRSEWEAFKADVDASWPDEAQAIAT